MPALLVPLLWAGGTAVVLGGGYYLRHLFRVSPRRRSRTGSAANTPQRKVEEVIHEPKQVTPRSGSGKKAKSRKPAVAVAVSESGQPQRRKPSQSRRRKAS
jgi:hypothetical protein